MEILRKKTILLVEDEAIIAMRVSGALQRHGFAVVIAYRGEDAVQLALERDDLDLVLMDINLGPGMDGTEAATRILAHRTIPVVFHSSHSDPEIVQRTAGITSYGYILKTAGDTVLFASIEMAFKLWESEERFRTAFEHAPMGMVLTSPEGIFLRANRAFCSMLGYAPQDLDSVSFSSLTHPEDLELSLAHVRTLLTGPESTCTFRKRYLHRDGHTVWTELNAVLLRDATGNPVHFVTHVQDITGRLADEENLRRYENIISSTSDAIALLDRSYRYRILNSAYERFAGRRVEELVGLTVAEYLGESFFNEHVKPHFDRCLNGETIEFSLWREYPIMGERYVSVTYFPYRDSTNEIQGVVALTRDLTSSRQLEDQQRLILDSTPFSVLVVQDGCYVYANPYGATHLGYDSPEDLVGTKVFDSIAPEYREIVSSRMQRIEARDPNPATEMVILRKDGERTVSESTSVPIIFDGRPAALVIGRDKTEQKRIEERLQAVEAIARVGHYEIDLLEGTAIWSPETFRIFGLEPGSDPPGVETYGNLVHEDDREAVMTHFEECLHRKQNFDLVYRIIQATGTFRYVHSLGELRYDGSGVPVRMVGTFQDVTDLQTARLEIERQRDRIASILSAVPTGIGVVQGADRLITEVNEKFCEITGYSYNEVVGQTARILYPDDEEYAFVGREKYRLIREYGTGAVETRWRRKDGSIIDVWLASTPIHSGDTSRGVTFSVLDITERKRAGAELQKALSEKELLLRETHHRVKNNMTIMESLLSLQADQQSDQRAREVLQEAASRARSMSVLYDRLYRSDFTHQILLGEFVPPLLEEITSALDISIAVQLEFDFEEILVDSRLLSPLGLIINELTTNSVKYALPHTPSGRVRLAARKEGTVARLIFEDNGPGIPEAVFREGGRGFGLQLCSALAGQMGGDFTVEQGMGARFSVTFPIVVPS